MKYFRNDKNNLHLLEVSGYLILMLLFQLFLGTTAMVAALYATAFILDAAWILEILKIPFGKTELIQLRINFNYGVFLFSIIFSLIVYSGFMFFVIKIFKKKNVHIPSRESLYDIYTGMIFFFGFFPVFMNGFLTEDTKQNYLEIFERYFMYLTITVAPYLYSLISVVYTRIQEKTFEISLEEYKMKRFNR